MVSSSDRQRSRTLALGAASSALMQKGIFDQAIVFWAGTSGHEYVHTIYSLAGCPEIPPASVLLVRRTETARRLVLMVMSVEHAAPSLNLAYIRQKGASVGANEVHVHFADGKSCARRTALMDLQLLHGRVEPIGI